MVGSIRDFWVERLLPFLRDQVSGSNPLFFYHKHSMYHFKEGVKAYGVMGTGWGSWVATRLSSYGEVESDKNNINASISFSLADPCLCQRAPLDQLGCGGGQGGPLRSAGGGELAHHQPGHEIMITNSPSLSNLSDIFVSLCVTL